MQKGVISSNGNVSNVSTTNGMKSFKITKITLNSAVSMWSTNDKEMNYECTISFEEFMTF